MTPGPLAGLRAMPLARFVLVAVVAVVAGCGSNPDVKKAQLLETGNSYLKRGKYREASLIYRRALQYDRRFTEAYYRLGLAEVALGRYLEAMQALQRAADLAPGNAGVYERLSDLYLAFYQADPKRFSRFLEELENLTERAEAHQVDAARTQRVRGFIEIGRQNHDKAIGHLREAHRLDPSEQRVVLGLAGALSLRGDVSEAERMALAALQADGAFSAAYDLLYGLYMRQGSRAKAEGVLRTKCQSNPKSLGPWMQLAAHYHRTGQAEARDDLLERLTHDPAEFPDAHLAAGDFYYGTGQLERAIQLYRRGAELNKGAGSTYKLRIAHALAFQGRTAEALQVVDEVLADNADDTDARHLRGALLVHGGDPKAAVEAIQELESLAARERDNAVLRYNLGKAYLAGGDLDKALGHFREAARVREYLAPRYELGRIYLAKDQPELAVQLASEILEIQPDSIAGRMLKATALLRTRNALQAKEVLRQILKRQPGNRQAQYLLATLNAQEKQFREAEPVLRRLHEDAPDDPRYWWSLSQMYVAQGRVEQAIETLSRQLARQPRSVEVRFARATVAANAKRYATAVEDFTEILKENPKDTGVHERLGTTYYLSGDLRAAESHYRKARELDPASVTASLRLALLVGEMGRKEEAKALLREVLTLVPDHPVVLNNLADLLAESSSDLDEALNLAQKAYRKGTPRSPRRSGRSTSRRTSMTTQSRFSSSLLPSIRLTRGCNTSSRWLICRRATSLRRGRFWRKR